MKRLSMLAACAWTAACAHRPPPPLHTTHLLVERSGNGVRPFVRATVAGRPVTLLLDTGAPRSILPAHFASTIRIAAASDAFTETMVDAHGNRVRMQTLKDVPVQFEGEATAGTLDFLVNPVAHIAEGILAPEDLLRPGWALVIDLEHEELRYQREEEALQQLGGAPALAEIDFKGCTFFEKTHRRVAAMVNGVPASMILDTGASATFLARNNPALPSMLSVKGKRGKTVAMTSTGDNLVVSEVPVVFANTTFASPVVVSAASQECGHGVLGADLLRHCTLVWGYKSLWAKCHAPTAD